MSIEFRTFSRQEELPKRMELFRKCFPETAGRPEQTESYYNWKYGTEVYAGKRYEFGAYRGNDLVGYYAALIVPYRIQGSSYDAAQVFDVMTDPDSRGEGIFTKLGLYALEEMHKAGIDFAITFPIRKAVMPGFLKGGWEIVQELPLYVSVLDIKGFVPVFLRFLSPLYRLVLWLLEKLAAVFTGDSGAECRARKAFDPGITDGTPSNPVGNDNGLGLTPDFLRWRLSNPISEYYMIDLKTNGVWNTVCVLARSDLKGIDSLAIIYLDNSTGLHAAHLFKQIRILAGELEVSCLASMNSRTMSKRFLFTRHWLFKTHLSFRAIIKQLNSELPMSVFQDEGSWNLMWINTDDV